MSGVRAGQGLGRGNGRAPKYDRDLIRKLYQDQGQSVTEIADGLGASSQTIIRALHAMGVRLDGHRLKATCPQGHLRTVWGHKNKDRWICRKCHGGNAHLFVLRRWGRRSSEAIFSTLQLAQDYLADMVWEESADGYWLAHHPRWGAYEIERLELDPED